MLKQIYSVEGMSCASCASSVECLLSDHEFIQKASVNFAIHAVSIVYDE